MSRIAALLATALFAFTALAPYAPPVTAASSTFVVLSTSWPSSTAAGPGSTNVQLTVDIEYTGGATATAVSALLRLPAGFTDTSGSNTPISGTASVSSLTIFHLKYNITIASSASVGTYSVPIQFTWTTTAGGNVVLNAETDTATINLLGTASLRVQPSQTTLNAGTVNVVTITLTNSGSGTATQIDPSVSTTAGSILTVIPVIASLGAHSSTELQVKIFIPASAAGSAVVLTFTMPYDDPYGTSESVTQAVGFQAVSTPAPLLTFTPSVTSLVPGQVNDVQITLSNLGPGAVSRVAVTITASSGFSMLNQIPFIPTLEENSSVSAVVRIFAPTSNAGQVATLTLAYSYIDPYGTAATSSQSLGFYVANTSSVSTGGVLSISASTESLVAGEQTTVAFTVTNAGSQPVYSPSFLLTVPSPLVLSSSSSLSLDNVVIPPDGSLSYNATISSPSSSTGGSYSGSLTVTYSDQSGNTYSQSTPVTFDLVIQIRQLSATSLSTEVFVGNVTKVEFQLSNTGNVPVYSPTITLAMPSGLAVTSNSTYSRPGLALAPGQSMRYEADVGSGPSASQAAFTGTLTVSYTDAYGNSYSQTFSPGFVLIAGIELVVQDISASQTAAGSMTVTGTLLNEGLGSAYYLEVTGSSAKGGQSTSYIGEVDPNTPVPFSLVMPYQAAAGGAKVDLQIAANYRNNYGQPLSFEYSSTVTVTGSSTTASSGAGSPTSGTGSDYTGILRYIIIAVILVSVAASALYVRRSRRTSRGSGAKSDVI